VSRALSPATELRPAISDTDVELLADRGTAQSAKRVLQERITNIAVFLEA
jgi:hypothetical protein